MQNPRIAILGAGTIGMSWAALFAATGREVTVFDPSKNTRDRLESFVKETSDSLKTLGWSFAGDTSKLRFTNDPAEAVAGADFIQENAPERLETKHQLYERIEPHLSETAIIGSSTSGLKLSDMQAGFSNPGRFILAHPFNPPHLIPLVELMGNEQTENGVLTKAGEFYESIGKVCIYLNKEIPGHIANRLQAALWRETIHLAMEGVASVGDIDKAVSYGPGLRWAALGPNALFHLGGGVGGIRSFCEHLGSSFENWWNDLGQPHLTPEIVTVLENGVRDSLGNVSKSELVKNRDELVLRLVKRTQVQPKEIKPLQPAR